MNHLQEQLKKRGVYFSTKLPLSQHLLSALQRQDRRSQASHSNLSAFRWKKRIGLPIVVCDQKLKKNPKVRLWLNSFPVYFVSAGERLKDFNSFPRHISHLLRISGTPSSLTSALKHHQPSAVRICGFVSLGGGSVGDFTGFTASVYQRGVPLIHIPTTWLSAMDSAHGGKTALNIGGVKNTIGAYCFPKAVFIAKDLLWSLPEKQRHSAKGELIKMALIEGGSFYSKIVNHQYSDQNLWQWLPQVILAKLKIVDQDPYEQSGYRQILNFGHTMGHVLESYFGFPHGEAVLRGMAFALEWSGRRFRLSEHFVQSVFALLKNQNKTKSCLKKIPPSVVSSLLLQDKKRVDEKHIQFVFIKNPGKVFVETVQIQDILKEVQRQQRGK